MSESKIFCSVRSVVGSKSLQNSPTKFDTFNRRKSGGKGGGQQNAVSSAQSDFDWADGPLLTFPLSFPRRCPSNPKSLLSCLIPSIQMGLPSHVTFSTECTTFRTAFIPCKCNDSPGAKTFNWICSGKCQIWPNYNNSALFVFYRQTFLSSFSVTNFSFRSLILFYFSYFQHFLPFFGRFVRSLWPFLNTFPYFNASLFFVSNSLIPLRAQIKQKQI